MAIAHAANRTVVDFNKNWQFAFVYSHQKNYSLQTINLPQTWNANDVMKPKGAYQRTAGVYIKEFFADPAWNNKRVFLKFEGVNSVADVFINKKNIGSHKGGYTAFVLEITPYLKLGKMNTVNVMASNSYRLDVLPLNGDFNVFGGIHRPVSLIITEANCISPLDKASSGVYFTQQDVSSKNATLQVKTILSLHHKKPSLKLTVKIMDGDKLIAQNVVPVTDSVMNQTINIKQPKLWHGKRNPHLYNAVVILSDGEMSIDVLQEKIGLRSFYIDADNGFFLNGEPYDLHGVGYHEDVQGKGSAYETIDFEKDMDLLKELGATALRMAHYPHGKPMYNKCDEEGIAVWTEIPLIGFGGHVGEGYVASDALHENAEQQLEEMIKQYYNHPSVFFWGLMNELTTNFDSPVPFIERLHQTAKKLDPSRLTVIADFKDTAAFSYISDIIAYNKYYGWYDEDVHYIGKWLDAKHAQLPERPVGLSEYGAGGSIHHHSDTLVKPITTARFHPEEWQTYFHESYWKQLKERKYLWGKFIWVFADFSSHIRNEGDTTGVNDKGLITYNRQEKKDAFYFYKANWNTAPMLYLAEKKFDQGRKKSIAVKAYTNAKSATLWVNNKRIGSALSSDTHIVQWPMVLLKEGKNHIKISADVGNQTLTDTAIWYR